MYDLRILLFSCAVISPLLVNAQSIIKGVVIDNDSEEPLSKTSIKIISNSEFVITNESGSFQLDLTKINTYDTLVVTHLGYGKYLLSISENNTQTDLVIRLKKEVTLLNEVSVFSEFWTKQYSPEQLKQDYEKFYTIMEKTHTGLFDYLKEVEWQALKDSSLQLCQYSMTHSEFYRLIALHVGRVRNMHTRHGVTDSWYKRKQNIFPFNIKYFGDKFYVSESLVKDLSFPKGSEITQIKGRTPEEIKSMIWPFIPADGYNETGKLAALNDYFPWFFSLFVEETEIYDIRLRTLKDEEVTISTPGLKDSFSQLSFQQVWKWKKSALELKVDDYLKTAYFLIEDSRVFKDSIQTYFHRILNKGVQHLIIDLRGEGGIREEEHVAELYSYLVSKPSRIYEPMQVKSNDYRLFDKDFSYKPYAKSLKQIKETYFDKLVDSGHGYYLWQQESYLELIKPAGIQFSGTVYILVDGRNYSASTARTSLH
ncbi:MAG: carboxypeptidase-like regulatory domain-containing protein [Cyclobacteriaceae bacterium]